MAAAAILTGVGGSLIATAPAIAADPTCGGHGIGARVDVANVKSLSTGANVGVVELCQRVDEGNVVRWAAVRISATTSGFASGNGRVVSGGLVSTCDQSQGGSGLLSPSRVTCSTGSIPRTAGAQYRADASLYDSGNKLIATGRTNSVG